MKFRIRVNDKRFPRAVELRRDMNKRSGKGRRKEYFAAARMGKYDAADLISGRVVRNETVETVAVMGGSASSMFVRKDCFRP